MLFTGSGERFNVRVECENNFFFFSYLIGSPI